MSYILDALKKAESERKSGTLAGRPELQEPRHSELAAPADEDDSRTKAWMRFGLTAVVAIVLGFVWHKMWRAAPPAVSPPPLAAAPAPQQHTPPVADTAPPSVQAPAKRPTVEPLTPIPSAPAPKEASGKPAKQKATPANEASAKKATKRAAPTESKPAETGSPAGETRIAALRELPPHIQNEIPKLKINGYIYSTNKADRTVLVENRLLHEGDQVAPELILEKLTPTGMVLNYKGYRYRASY
ncbi:MAG: ral secretion pathway protein [Burkholderiales bacterium]|jgi:general secretion pathway protein B